MLTELFKVANNGNHIVLQLCITKNEVVQATIWHVFIDQHSFLSLSAPS